MKKYVIAALGIIAILCLTVIMVNTKDKTMDTETDDFNTSSDYIINDADEQKLDIEEKAFNECDISLIEEKTEENAEDIMDNIIDPIESSIDDDGSEPTENTSKVFSDIVNEERYQYGENRLEYEDEL